jgi:splicing factor U2AF subunit
LSKLGIIGRTVLDGPNKIIIHGWHHKSQEKQVLKILQTFGEVKAFHLFKKKDDIALKRVFCFVQYVNLAQTPVAVAGLNGMDLTGGKALTAQLHCQ